MCGDRTGAMSRTLRTMRAASGRGCRAGSSATIVSIRPSKAAGLSHEAGCTTGKPL